VSTKVCKNKKADIEVDIKATESKRVFPFDESLLKSLYIVAVELDKKWSKKPITGWDRIYRQLSILFEGRI